MKKTSRVFQHFSSVFRCALKILPAFSRAISRFSSVLRRRFRHHGHRYWAQVVLASQLLNLLLPFTGLVSPLQANNLIKPTQKGDSLFESVNPGFKAEFGDREQPTQHKLRFEAAPVASTQEKQDGNGNTRDIPILQKAKEAVLGTASKGIELRLTELSSQEKLVTSSQEKLDKNGNTQEGLPSVLKDVQSQIEEVESGLEKVETGITSVSKDVAEVTKVTKNILEESGVGKPELSVRPSMEETPEDFARTADPQSAPPSAYSLPIDTVSQTIDETTKVEYQVIVGRGVKESLTLLSTPEKQDANGKTQDGLNQFTFELKLDQGVEARRALDGLADSQPGENKDYNGYKGYPAERDPAPQGNNSGVIYFVDQFGRYLFHFETPFMVDASGSRSSAVTLDIKPLIENCDIKNLDLIENCPAEQGPALQDKLKIENSASRYVLTLTADNKWLMDAGRIYPILIDPTIVHENNPAFASGTENRSQTTTSPAVEIQYKELQPDINTVGLWHFNSDNNVEQTVYDSSGNGYHAYRGEAGTSATAPGDPTWSTSGKLGSTAYKSMDFDGVDDYAEIGTGTIGTALNGAKAVTIEAWVYVKSLPGASARERAVNVFDATGTTGAALSIYNTTGQVEVAGRSVSTDGFQTARADFGVTKEWHHLAGVYDYPNDLIYVYIDGQLKLTQAVTFGNAAYTQGAPSGDEDTIGATADVSGDYIDALIDEVRISNRARTPEEIAASASRYPYAVHESPVIDFGSTPNTLDSLNYSATGVQTGDGEKPFSSDGLVAQWNFNETSGTTAYNMAGNDSCGGTPSSCNLTLNNFASTSSQDQAAGTGWTANDKRWGAGSINISSTATADTLSLSNPSTLDPNSADLSIETWVKTTDVTAELFSNNSANGVSCTSDGYYLGIDASGYPVFTLDTDGATAGCDATITSGITKKVNDGVWHHLAATVTRGSAAYLYMDGALIGSDTSITAYSSEAPSGNVLIGSTNNFDGTLDSLRFYARALTASEVLANSQVGNIEFQTRTGATSTPNDGTWEAWRSTSGSGDTQIVSNDSGQYDTSDANMVSYWKLDGNATDAKDSNNGTITEATSTNGRFSTGYNFDGTNDVITVTQAANINLTSKTAYTMEAWFKADTDGEADVGQIVQKGAATFIRVDTQGTDNTLDVEASFDLATTDATLNITDATHTSNWTHLALVYEDDADDEITLYINGVNMGSSTNGVGSPATESNDLLIGGTTTANFDGVIDEVAIWNDVRTAAEIAQDAYWAPDLINNAAVGGITTSQDTTTKIEGTASEKLQIGSPQVDAPTVGLWHLEETSGTLAYIKDATANANHGTPTGTTVVDGFYGKGRSFDGSGDYVSIGPTPTSMQVQTFTISSWIKTTSTSGEIDIISAYDNVGGQEYGYIFYLNAGTPTLWWNDGVASGAIFTASTTINDGKWHNLTLVVNSSSSRQFYIDGIANNSNSTSESVGYSNTDVYFGIRYSSGTATYLGDFSGLIDEVRISNTARSAEEIAEAYRAGRDHRLTKTITSTDLSAKTKLPFYVASDRPGTFLEATIGESAYANYEPDANTVGLWHLEEQTGSGAYIKDSSGNGNNGTPTGTTFAQGKIGASRNFTANTNEIIMGSPTNVGNLQANDFSVFSWVKTSTTGVTQYIVTKAHSTDVAKEEWQLKITSGNVVRGHVYHTAGDAYVAANSSSTVTDGNWHLVGFTWVSSSNTLKVYVDGKEENSSSTTSGTKSTANNGKLQIGDLDAESSGLIGNIDEVTISNVARTVDQIRQAYEIGKRTHPVTIDFKADLDSSNLIANTSDLSFAINPDVDTAGVGEPLNIAKGEKIIVKENVNGTEYIAQGTVSAVTYANGISNANAPNQNATNASTSTITVTAWDSGATAPSGGFTTAATVFKWQREYMDLTQITQSTHRDAITRITMRVIDGSQGANIWLDDFESADYSGGPSTSSGSSSIAIGSTVNRYFQYRAVLTSGIQNSVFSIQNSPSLTNVTINYNSGTTPQPPRTKDASSDFTATGASLDRITDTGSSNSPSLELAYKELSADINTVGLWHMNENAANTCTGGINDVCDKSGKGYDGAFNGDAAHTTTAKFGASATTYDGSGDFVSIGTSPAIDSSDFTLEAWIKTSVSTDARGIITNDNDGNGIISLRVVSGNAFAQVRTVAGTGLVSITGVKVVSDGNWHHLAMTRSGNTVSLYVDGNSEGTGTTVAGDLQESNWIIGARNGGASIHPFSGTIDEVRISNIARTPEEIKLDAQRRPYGVYTSDVQNLGTNVSSIDNLRWTENGVQTGDGETPFNSNGLVAAWNFNETSGTAATVTSTSSCGSACNATLNNFASTTSQDQAAGTGWTKDNRRWGTGAIMIASAATADTITVTDPASNTLDPNSADLTISMWVKTNDVTAELLSNNANNGTACTANGYYLGIDASGYPNFYLDTNGATAGCDAQISSLATGKINDGNWHYLAVSVTRGTSALMYLDGVQIGSDTSVTSYSSITVTGNIQIGSNANYDGALDTIQVYTRALSAAEILSNYQAGNIEFQTRTSADNATWEAWKPTTSEAALDAVDSLSPVEKISQTSLTAYWKLDETSGSRADSKGSNTLTDNNTVTYAPGRLSNAGQFTAANSEYLSIADNADLSTGDIDFSIAGWLYLDSKSALMTFIGKQAASDREYTIIYNPTPDRLQFEVRNTANTAATTVNADNFGAVPTGQWLFVVAWHDAAGDTINIQINNGTANSASTTGGVRDGTAQFEIGRTQEASGYFWNGKIDEVGFWKRTLTAAERTRLFEDGLDLHGAGSGRIYRTRDTATKIEGTGSEKLTLGAPQVDSSTVGLWHMEETSGTGAYIKDATANANHGTPTGTTVVDGFYGKGRSFNGSSDYISVGALTGGTAVQSIEFWTNPSSTSTEFIDLDAGTHYINVSSGTVAATGFTSPTIYVNGVVSSTLVANAWQHVAVTTGTSFNASNTVIGKRSTSYLSGKIDEVRVSNVVRTAEEIAEAYRAGRDHRLTKSVSSVDLSAKSKVPFYIASDRPGTFLEATVGESAYANYEPDTNTKGLWHLDEQTGSGAYLKDSSGLGMNGTPTGTAFIQAKIGKGRDFTANTDIITTTTNNTVYDWSSSTDVTLDGWYYWTSAPATEILFEKWDATNGWTFYTKTATTGLELVLTSASVNTATITSNAFTWPTNQWVHVALTKSGNTYTFYFNGQSVGSTTNAAAIGASAQPLVMGKRYNGTANTFTGNMDEPRYSSVARSADEIRQAYEVGKRTHQITNDFVTSPQAAYSSGTSVTINNPYGTTNLTDTLSIGDTMIFKENVGGTETVSQAVVTGITNTSAVYGTVTLLAAPTFPSGGFTTNATVFKWQREFFDLTGILGSPVIASGSVAISSGPNQKDAISRITLRITDGSQGANIWLDDFKSAGPYLSVGSARTSTIASTPQQYFQYRVIFSTTDTALSPSITHISLQYHSDPQKVTGADTFASGTYDNDGNVQLGSNNVKDVYFYDRTKDQISYALDFDNSNDYVAVGTGPTSVKTVEFWVNPNSTSTEFIDLNGSAYINVSSGTIGTTGFTSPTVYVDGAVSSTVVANKWQHIAVTTGTGLNATALNFGKRSTSYFNGIMDEVALYSTALTAAQVTTDYNIRRLAGTESGLVALYHFDEGSGTRAYDSASTNHGTLTNMTDDDWVNSLSDRDQSSLSQQVLGVDPNWANGVGRRSNALDFNGSSDYVNAGTNSSLSLTSTMTIETWINTDTIAATQGVIVSKFTNGGTDALRGFQYMLYRSSATLVFTRGDGTTDPEDVVITPSVLTVGNWYHVIAVDNGSTITIYVNGSQVTTPVSKARTPISSTSPTNIGLRNGGTPIWYFDGSIDEVSIFNTARTATQISSDYNARRLKGNETGLVGLWHFDEGEFNTCSGGTNDACDASSSANDGAATGTTWVTDARAVMDNNARYVSLGASSAVNSDRGMELKITSTTAFQYRWTGDQTWTTPATSTLSSYSFTSPAQIDSTGVYVGFDTTNGTFGDESYFLIPSWALEQFSNADSQNAMRGTKRGFPERSYLVATDKGVDILDADTNNLWMRMENGSGRSLGTFTNNTPSSVFMSHGQLFVGTNGTAATGLYRYDFNRDKIYRYNATNRTTNTVNIAKRNTADSSYGSADTGQNLISSVVNDVFVLTIQGKCVTGDTLLRRRRRKNGKWVYDDVRIDEIEVGDDILTLNEKTGKFEWQIVEVKKNMGVKDTWQIITESGKKIRATSDHKFLVQQTSHLNGTFEVDQSNRIEDLNHDSYVAIANEKFSFVTTLSKAEKAKSQIHYKKDKKMFGPVVWARLINHMLTINNIDHAKLILDYEYGGYEKTIQQIIQGQFKNISVEFRSIGKDSPAHHAAYNTNPKTKGHKKATGALTQYVQVAEDVLHPEFTGIRTSSSRLSGVYQDQIPLSRSFWTQLSELSVRQQIITENGWEKIVSIHKVGREQVWDIRVSKNHNFVGNGLVAHNCMLAAATDTGVTKISNIMSSDTSYDYSDNASDDYGHVVLAETAGGSGDLYADNDTTDALERWNNVLDDAASETAGTPDTTYDESSTPAIFVSAQEINDIKIQPQSSTVENVSPAVYIAHDLGTTVLNEKRSDPTNGSVKYLNSSRVTEEMIGDTNGMWSLDDVNDSSVKANNLTNNASVTFTTSGVRGKAAHFTRASSQYLSKADNASLSTGNINFTILAWIYFDTKTASGENVVAAKGDTTVGNGEEWLLRYEAGADRLVFLVNDGLGQDKVNADGLGSPSLGTWYFVVGWYDATADTVNIQVNNGAVNSTASTTGAQDSAYEFVIGRNPNHSSSYFDGRIDEVLFTKEVLTAAQRTQLYVAGKEALNNKYRVKLASDTLNELAGDDNTVKAVGVSKLNQTGVTRGEYLYVGTNGTSADDGSLSRILVNGDTRDREYDESTKEPYLLTDNDINSVSISNDGAYIVVGTDDAGVTIIQNGSTSNRLRGGSKVQGPYKRPHN